MGIKNFYKFLQKYSPESFIKRKIGDYSGKTLGVDANLILYTFLKKNINYLLKINNGNINDNIDSYEMFYYHLMEMVLCSYKNNIKLLMVFDGKTPDIKKGTVFDRKIEREKAKNELKEMNEIIDEDISLDDEKKKKDLLIKTVHLNSKLIKSVKEILGYCGIPCIDAPYEADTQLAYLSKNNYIDGIISNDFDNLTFGGKKIILDFFGYKNDYFKPVIELDLENILKNLQINYDTFVELCILMGSDYSDKPQYSYEYIFNLLKQHGNYNNIPEKNEFKLPENLDIEHIKKYFKYPEIDEYNQEKYVQLKFFSFEENNIIEFLNKHKKLIFNDRYYNNLLGAMKRILFFTILKNKR